MDLRTLLISTVRLSSNDHFEMGVFISQLLDFKTMCFNIVLSPLGIQGLNAIAIYEIPTMEFIVNKSNKIVLNMFSNSNF